MYTLIVVANLEPSNTDSSLSTSLLQSAKFAKLQICAAAVFTISSFNMQPECFWHWLRNTVA